MVEVLVLGGGYASLSFIKSLPAKARAQYRIRLISQTPLHYFSVLLHEVLAGLKGQYTLPLSEILPKEVEFIQDRILEIQEGLVIAQEGSYRYDKLVVGLGFRSESFGVPGVEVCTQSITNFENAQETHQKLLNALQNFREQRPFSVVVCGAGFSGVELVGALSDTLPIISQGKAFQITCIEAMPTILPMFKPTLAQKGFDYLQKLGVTMEVGTKILACKSHGILVEKEGAQREILADFLVWTCGVRGSEVIDHSAFLKGVRGRVEVNSFLEPVHLPGKGIFILGDCAGVKTTQGRFYPPTAQLARQMGIYLAREFTHADTGQSKNPFIFSPQGTLCSFGTCYAIGQIGPFCVRGKVAIWIKKYIEWNWKRFLLGH
ncbi:NAD(P)/FAD-dependent oxidoreductase [Helicobacter cynogastricus]|uniref:NAD(P)/FAD-dependent oxidoreductase n=1 Tax=Helicobacter cynogastricus TaxID=329937 RepID=UPI000CF11565|nr:FAD-dependent oxidoreductase [Helicobacter cynogastricus]